MSWLVGVGGVGAERGVFAFESVVEIGVEHAGFGERVDLVGASSAAVSADRLSRVCSAAAGLEARQRSSAMADHQRTRWRTLLSLGSATCSRA